MSALFAHQETYSNGSDCCIVVAFDTFICNELEVSGDVDTSSSGPDTSGRDFTKSFKKSNRLSDKMHCFLETCKLSKKCFVQKEYIRFVQAFQRNT